MELIKKVEIIAYHGWGMNAQFWDKWDDVLPEHVILKKNDRGYFGNATNHSFKESDAVRILFVQGFGMHWVSNFNWENAHLIVLYSAFNNLKDIMKKSRTVDHVVSLLQDEIETHPYKTLELFWKEMFKTENPTINIEEFEIRNKQRLINDLNVYYHDLVDKVTIKPSAKVMLYETEIDDLSIFSQVTEMKNLFGRLDYYKQFDFVGHAFPFNQAKACYEDLASHLKVF